MSDPNSTRPVEDKAAVLVDGDSHAGAAASQGQASHSNRNRPNSVVIPSPQHSRARASSPLLGPKPTTPTGGTSFSPSGPLSPSTSNPNQFVFPIRSVYQGMDPHPTGSGEASSSRLTRGSSGAPPSSRSSGLDERRFSESFAEAVQGDSTMQSIHELLQQGQHKKEGRDSTPAVAQFQGKGGAMGPGRTGDHIKAGEIEPSSAQPGNPSPNPHQGFFSSPIQKSTDNQAFFTRRNSVGEAIGRSSAGGEATAGARGAGDVESSRGEQDPSAEGQPSGPARFRHFPGEVDEQTQSFTVSGQQLGSATPTRESSSRTSRAAEPARSTTTPELRQPKPHHADRDRALQRISSRDTPKPSEPTTPDQRRPNDANEQPVLEHDDQGIQNVVQDFAGIVRLTEAGSLSSGIGGTSGGPGSGSAGTRSSKGKPLASGTAAPSMATEARLAKQNRQNFRDSSNRNSVRDYLQEQSHFTTMADPNAPTPSPGPGATDDTDAGMITDDEREADAGFGGVGLGISTPGRESIQGLDTDLDTAESSEMAVGSGTGDGETEASEEKPIVTVRFEHVQTADGHHVVTGREGVLSRCEDEPITTPGAVQGFGVLIVLEEDYDTGTLTVRQASENSTELLGLSPRYMFRLDCFSKILTTDQEDILRDNIEYLPMPDNNAPASTDDEGPQVFLLSGFGEPGSDEATDEDTSSDVGSRRREWTCWVAAHRPRQPSWNKIDEQGRPIPAPDFIVLEFELEKDIYNPLMQAFEGSAGESSGLETPDSGTGSQGTLSGGSLPATNSTGSGGSVPTISSVTAAPSDAGTTGSTTTIGTTPRPPPAPSDGSKTMSVGSGSTPQLTTSTRTTSYRIPRGSQPMGLEGIEVDHPIERIIESTTNHARPLRALERMRRVGQSDGTGESATNSSGRGTGSGGSGRGRPARPTRSRQPTGSTGTMDVFAVLGQINDQLGAAPDLETFLKISVGVVQDLCRFHRVLIYQFDESMNGQVVSELVEWGKTTDLFKGLMFPASDIPAQARELYKINKVRLLYDRSQTTARMILRSREDLEHPLDMTHCYLRAMSPIHIKYLANMHVRSSMSVSIMAFGQLWGLIACHSYGHHGMRVSFPVRQMMRLLSDSISRNIERLSYAQRLHTRKLISTIPTQAHPTGYIVSNADDLLQIFDADSGLLVIGDGCKLLGQSDQGHAMLAIAEYLRIVKFDTLKASNHIQKDLPDLLLPRAHDTIAGLLYVPLTAKAGQDFIVFFRKGQVREVQWAGKPYKDEKAGAEASLEPRKSFKTWSETVTGRARAWTDDQLESAGVLALIYGKFIQVWREKQSAMVSNQLTAILLSNTSHAVRTPLSQIINTLELALSGNIDAETRSMLENSHQASRALLFHVHDLLDLTRIETGNETAFNDPFDLRQTIADAVRLYQTETQRRNIDFRVVVDDDLPNSVIGDSRKIKTVISNLVANSVKFTREGSIEVACRLQHGDLGTVDLVRQGYVPIEIVISDTGCGIPREKLEAMFVTLEGVEEIRPEGTGLGLGLAVVARIVEQLAGQLRAESEVDIGTRFFFTLQMQINDGRPRDTAGSRGSSSLKSHKSPASAVVSRPRTGSSGSNSIVSMRSGADAASEIDSFVNDFGVSHMLAPVPADDKRLRDAEERMTRPGTFPVTDSSWPVRPTKVDQDSEQSMSPPAASPHMSQSSILSGAAGSAPQSPQASVARRVSQRRERERSATAIGSSIQSRGLLTRADSKSSVPQVESPSSISPPASGATPSERTAKKPPTVTESPPVKPTRVRHSPDGAQRLRVMVVEDDMINSQILQKRLKMDKHEVIAVYNGQEAVDALRKDLDIDAVLMDIQMPIMDGRTAAKEIRKLEAGLDSSAYDHIDPLRVDGRIPVIAVSASLYESDRGNLMTDFDGWLLKPLDFNRVRALLKAAEDDGKRNDEVYVQGHWERGGYFRAPNRATDSSPNS